MGTAEVLEPWLVGPFGLALAAVLGALFGSFANVCVYRMPPTDAFPEGRSVVHPPSHCSACQAPIAWYDNVPLLAYLWLRGRCRRCGAGFSPRYLLIEGATALLFAAVYHLEVVVYAIDGAPLGLRLARAGIAAAFVLALVIITFIDLDHMLILDRITYPAIPLCYAGGLAFGRAWWEGLVGAAIGYGTIRGIADLYYLLTRRHGMGYGDGKLLAMVGALFGWQGVLIAMFAGSLLGSVVTLGYLAIVGRPPAEADADADADADPDAAPPVTSIRHVAFPFGPFLAAGAILYLFAEPWIRAEIALRVEVLRDVLGEVFR